MDLADGHVAALKQMGCAAAIPGGIKYLNNNSNDIITIEAMHLT